MWAGSRAGRDNKDDNKKGTQKRYNGLQVTALCGGVVFVRRHQVRGAATVLLLFPLLLFPLLLLLLLIQTPLTVGSLQLISPKNVTVPVTSNSLPGNSSQDLILTMLGPASNLLCAEATPMLPLKAVLGMAAAKAEIRAKEALIVAVECALLVGLA